MATTAVKVARLPWYHFIRKAEEGCWIEYCANCHRTFLYHVDASEESSTCVHLQLKNAVREALKLGLIKENATDY